MGFIFTRGLFTVVGNREDFPASHGWMGRSHRAHLNMVENLVPFAALILAAQASGQADAWTALGAQVFFYSRIVHAVVYTVGVPWLRTLAWFGGVIGDLWADRSEEHTSELQSLMRISYAVFCLKKKTKLTLCPTPTPRFNYHFCRLTTPD